MSGELSPSTGIVVIGRNEGERLRECLQSIALFATQVLYVDSASTDDSVALAKTFHVEVLELNPAIKMTAARARNEGCERLASLYPNIEFVQFVDGDCLVDARWLPQAEEFLASHASVGVVCGRRREKHPDHSLYNALLDLEWDTPIGLADSCGGDALFRLAAFQQAGGFLPGRIAGEEPELCLRVRRCDWEIHRLDIEMTLHDGDLHHFRQWWMRTVRAGYAFASGAWLHIKGSEQFWVRESLSIVFWALILPLVILVASLISSQFLWLLLIYPLQFCRLVLRRNDLPLRLALVWSALNVVGKFAEFQGVLQFLRDPAVSNSELIEYK